MAGIFFVVPEDIRKKKYIKNNKNIYMGLGQLEFDRPIGSQEEGKGKKGMHFRPWQRHLFLISEDTRKKKNI